ncbi:MAG: family 20 glycosylhydrolase [Puniceicoccales bacterium]|jgi:hypothetical protein|nr:family 20 glycosylhydrolase [Puniceicoccales bacterium]
MPPQELPFLFPRPREIIRHGGAFALPADGTARLPAPHFLAGWPVLHEAAKKFLHQSGDRLRLSEGDGTDAASGSIGAVQYSRETPPQGYTLEIAATGITLRAADGTGAFYGILTLAQILRACGAVLPCLTCIDSPELSVRGFMLDISRCKVPTMDTLHTLVEQLAVLRINQLQLYTEHTFAYAGHEIVWRDASPMTPDEVRQLDAHCRAHAIELVPNQQSFGHMERWLKHPAYRSLAECPDGFFHALADAHRPAGTLRPAQPALDFVGKLYDALLPCFSSKQLNIGGDEPWELGQGWSKPLCDAHGRHAVYTEHLRGIHKLVAAHGRTMQFWADILLEDPAHAAAALPIGAVPVIWGYDAGHPFPEQCATLEKTGFAYLVAPGSSAWQTFHGRLDNALANVNEAVRAANAHGARGILVTTWGDNGNHQPWWTFYPALAAAAAQAWNLAANAGADLAQAIGAVFLDGDTATAQCLLDLGKTDNVFTKQIRNKSILWELLFAPEEKLTPLLAEIPDAEIGAVAALTTEIYSRISPAPGNAQAALVRDECRAAQALSELAISRARLVREGIGAVAANAAFREEARRTIEIYEAAWLLRARRGGLSESVGRVATLFQIPTAPDSGR